MQKQINPTIKAHLIRSAFYLVLLVAVCALPFVLAQPGIPVTNNRGVAKPGARLPQLTSAKDMLALQASQRPVPMPHPEGIKGNATIAKLIGRVPQFTYVIDDGTAEDSVGYTSGSTFVACNSFPVTGGNNVITSISIAWGTPAFPDPTLNGLPYTAVLWSDPNGDGSPTDAVVLASAPGVISQQGTNTFITTAIPPTMVTTANFFVGFIITQPGNQLPAAIDETAPTFPNRSWIALTSNIHDLSSAILIESTGVHPGNWLIRANGQIGGGGTPTPMPGSHLGNISTRAFVQTGDSVMIGGFIVQGTQPKRVIIRAIGPELGVPPYNIPNALANPTLELHDGTGTLIASNNDWMTTIIGGIITSNQVSDIQNSGHAPTASSESAIVANLPPGNYTAIVRGVNNTTGIALVEVYDLNPGTTNSILGNISTRSFVQTGNNVMIGGFIIQGTQPKRVIVRAIGPELAAPPFNIPNALADPTLELHDGTGTLIASNNDWMTTIIGGIITTNQVSDIQNSGHAPTAASESAIVANLAPGNYTAIVRGVNNTTGVALVEVYDLQ